MGDKDGPRINKDMQRRVIGTEVQTPVRKLIHPTKKKGCDSDSIVLTYWFCLLGKVTRDNISILLLSDDELDALKFSRIREPAKRSI